MIRTGGESIYPAEVENALFRYPSLADAAVIGVPDDTWGEAVTAIVVLKSGASRDASEIMGWVRAHRELQDAEVGRFRRLDPAQSLGKDPQARIARALLESARPQGQLKAG